jgi:hypothetical protein
VGESLDPRGALIDPDRIARRFGDLLEVERVEPVSRESAHSGTAFFVTARGGERYKLRYCGSRLRAAALERWVRALPEVLPRLVARRERFVLLEVLEEHEPISRRQLMANSRRLGRIAAQAHAVGTARHAGDRALRALIEHRFRARFSRDLRLLRDRGVIDATVFDAAAAKFRARIADLGLPIALELDDLHKGNWLIRERDNDLRYVDEEGLGLRPKGIGLATLARTLTRRRFWTRYVEGYAQVGDPGFLTDAYMESLLLMNAVRRVAHKVRTEQRLEKLPDDAAEISEMAATPDVALDWCFPADEPATDDDE